MLLFELAQGGPGRRVGRLAREGEGRAQLEQFPHFEELERELLGETADDPAGVRPPLHQAEAREAVEVIAYGDRGNLEFARQLEPVDLLIGLAVAAENPVEELLLDAVRGRDGILARKVVPGSGFLADVELVPPPGDDAAFLK